LKREYSDQQKITDYLEIYPKRHEFVKAWASKIKNFGHNVTSSGEGGHHYLKSFLEGNHHDLILTNNGAKMNKCNLINI
jgi:hypothetical protein